MRQMMYQFDDIFRKKEEPERLGIDIFGDKERVERKTQEALALAGIKPYDTLVEDLRAEMGQYRVHIKFARGDHSVFRMGLSADAPLDGMENYLEIEIRKAYAKWKEPY